MRRRLEVGCKGLVMRGHTADSKIYEVIGNLPRLLLVPSNIQSKKETSNSEGDS